MKILNYCITYVLLCINTALANDAKINSYSFELENEFLASHNLKVPYGAVFKTDKGNLIYLASEHQTNVNSKTFQLIKSSFEKFSPNLVMVEGIERGIANPYGKYMPMIEEKCLPISTWKCADPLYSIYLANEAGIDFIGLEPDDENIFNDIIKSTNYTFNDIILYYFIRQLPQYKLEGRECLDAEFKQCFIDFFTSSNFADNSDTEYLFKEYEVWAKNHVSLSIEELLDANNIYPNKNGNYLQRISDKIGVLRDEFMIKNIKYNTAKYK